MMISKSHQVSEVITDIAVGKSQGSLFHKLPRMYQFVSKEQVWCIVNAVSAEEDETSKCHTCRSRRQKVGTNESDAAQ